MWKSETCSEEPVGNVEHDIPFTWPLQYMVSYEYCPLMIRAGKTIYLNFSSFNVDLIWLFLYWDVWRNG